MMDAKPWDGGERLHEHGPNSSNTDGKVMVGVLVPEAMDGQDEGRERNDDARTLDHRMHQVPSPPNILQQA